MKFDPASSVRQAAAIRLMQRVEAIDKQVAVVVPMAGDPEPGKSVLDRQREFEEHRAIRIALKGEALRQTQHGGFNTFVAAKKNAQLLRGENTEVHRSVIQRLIDKGQMRWVNSSHSAAVLVEAPPGPQ